MSEYIGVEEYFVWKVLEDGKLKEPEVIEGYNVNGEDNNGTTNKKVAIENYKEWCRRKPIYGTALVLINVFRSY